MQEYLDYGRWHEPVPVQSASTRLPNTLVVWPVRTYLPYLGPHFVFSLPLTLSSAKAYSESYYIQCTLIDFKTVRLSFAALLKHFRSIVGDY